MKIPLLTQAVEAIMAKVMYTAIKAKEIRDKLEKRRK
jgi:hypothetical protein